MSRRMAVFRVLARVVAAVAARRTPDPVGARGAVARFERLLRPARGVTVSHLNLAGVAVLHLHAGGSAQGTGTVLHVHGGAYTSGCPRTAFALSSVTRGGGPDVVSVDYRLAPEHPYPAAVDDVLTVYSHLLSTIGPERIVVVGESSGGGLALAMLLRARDEGLALPAGIALSFPWVDLTQSGASYAVNDGKDLLSRTSLAASATQYAASQDPTDPYVSPLFGSFEGFTDTLIVVGQVDVLLDDSRRLAAQMRSAGVTVDLREWAGSMHGFTGLPTPEGRQASQRVMDFVLRRLPSGEERSSTSAADR